MTGELNKDLSNLVEESLRCARHYGASIEQANKANLCELFLQCRVDLSPKDRENRPQEALKKFGLI